MVLWRCAHYHLQVRSTVYYEHQQHHSPGWPSAGLVHWSISGLFWIAFWGNWEFQTYKCVRLVLVNNFLFVCIFTPLHFHCLLPEFSAWIGEAAGTGDSGEHSGIPQQFGEETAQPFCNLLEDLWMPKYIGINLRILIIFIQWVRHDLNN